MYTNIKNIVIAGSLAGLLLVLFVPFIEYDTGIRCITTPCDSSDTGTLFEFLSFSLEKSVADIDYYIPLFWFLFFFIIVSGILFYIEKKR